MSHQPESPRFLGIVQFREFNVEVKQLKASPLIFLLYFWVILRERLLNFCGVWFGEYWENHRIEFLLEFQSSYNDWNYTIRKLLIYLIKTFQVFRKILKNKHTNKHTDTKRNVFFLRGKDSSSTDLVMGIREGGGYRQDRPWALQVQQCQWWKGASLAVQWWRPCLPAQGVHVQSLVGELRSYILTAKNPKHKTGAIL